MTQSKEQKADIRELLEDIEMHVVECEMKDDGKCDVKKMYSMLWGEVEKSLKRDERLKQIIKEIQSEHDKFLTKPKENAYTRWGLEFALNALKEV